MERHELICIQCPLGCAITAETENGRVVKVTGNSCKRGDAYAHKELTNPTRIVTSTVKLENSWELRLPVKTETDVPKDKVLQCVKALKNVSVQAPVSMGDVVLRDAAGTGVNVIATKTVGN